MRCCRKDCQIYGGRESLQRNYPQSLVSVRVVVNSLLLSFFVCLDFYKKHNKTKKIYWFLCGGRPASLALLCLNKAILFMKSKFNLSVAGMATLIAKLHGWPIVIGSALQIIIKKTVTV